MNSAHQQIPSCPRPFKLLFPPLVLALFLWFGVSRQRPEVISQSPICGPESHRLPALNISQPCEPIRWLHVPKTGSSFLNTLAFWACPELPNSKVIDSLWGHTLDPDALLRVSHITECLHRFSQLFRPDEDGPYIDSRFDFILGRKNSYDYKEVRDFIATRIHMPLPKNISEHALAHTFSFFREPMDRLLSHYMHSIKLWRENDNFSLKHANGEEACAYLRGNNPRHLKFMSLYTVMLTGPYPKGYIGAGRGDQTDRVIDVAEAQEACRRVKKLGFVGLTSQWEKSICLFHAEWGGKVRSAELLNTRPNDLMKSRAAAQLTKNWPCQDELDTMVYQCALDRFEELSTKHQEQCGHL